MTRNSSSAFGEASIAARLRHRHIVAVFDRGQWEGIHYIAMEYASGRSLKSLIRAEAPLAPARASELVGQLLRAVRYIHERGIVHRDLKPDNLTVRDPGLETSENNGTVDYRPTDGPTPPTARRDGLELSRLAGWVIAALTGSGGSSNRCQAGATPLHVR